MVRVSLDQKEGDCQKERIGCEKLTILQASNNILEDGSCPIFPPIRNSLKNMTLRTDPITNCQNLMDAD